MAFTPSTIVYLCDVPLENDLKNQLTFASVAAQTSYFESKTIKSYTNFTYQRKDNIIRVPDHIDNLYACNYVRYQNSNFSNKWFYAFIVSKSYVNDHCTHLQISTDPFQTYMFDITYYNSFVVREHVADDTIGKHTLPEPVSVSEPVVNHKYLDLTFSAETIADFNNNFWCAVFTTDKIFSDLPLTFYPDNFIGGNACPLYIYAPDSINNLTPFINYLVSNNKIDSIVAIVPLLKNYTNSVQVPTTELPTTFYLISDGAGLVPSIDPTKQNYNIYPSFVTPSARLDGYTPKNNKMYTSPFCYGVLQSSNGSKIRLDYETWNGGQNPKTIHTVYSATADPSIIAIPYDYRGDDNGAQYAVSFSGFPPIPFKYDTFDKWYAANKNSVDFGMFRKVGEMAAGLTAAITTGNINAAINPALAMEAELSRMDDLKNKPDSLAGNISNNPLLYDNRGGIQFFEICVKYEYAKMIDEYFTAYGYCINEVKNPQNSMNTRLNWNYIETRNINISGDIPDEDLAKLRRMFNTGVTMWHNPLTFGDYSQNNAIV
jgi:hypothetical protein